MTLKYGNVYLEARAINSNASSCDNTILYGLILGIITTSLPVIMPILNK
jgi:tetrahydromethanopterin S-methyltransferase subunit G